MITDTPIYPEAERLCVQAQHLKPGDLLIPTQRVVVWVGQTIRTPGRKVTVHLRDRRGRVSASHFWKQTDITIRRPRPAEPGQNVPDSGAVDLS
jgi:hypothetical protein